jgi:hypothetical protein
VYIERFKAGHGVRDSDKSKRICFATPPSRKRFVEVKTERTDRTEQMGVQRIMGSNFDPRTHPLARLEQPDSLVYGGLEYSPAAIRLDDLAEGEEAGEVWVGEHDIGGYDGV